MQKISFENAELYFREFHIGTLTGEIEFRGSLISAAVEKISKTYYSLMHSPDLILHFTLKEKSPAFLQLLENAETYPSVKQLLSDFGPLQIIAADRRSFYINDAFWIRYPVPEFQIKRNSGSMIHSLYFLWA